MQNTKINVPQQNFVFQLDVYEGPLDVLLALIRDRDIDVFDIPIHQIASEFQLFVEAAKHLELACVGEFVKMAAELAYIKSQLLLPVPLEEEDPRSELVKKLMEHEHVQQIADFLENRTILGKDVFGRGVDLSSDFPTAESWTTTIKIPSQLSEFLERALVRQREKRKFNHTVLRESVSVSQQISWLWEQLKVQRRVFFADLIAPYHRKEFLIATFLAILELSRLHRIRITQPKYDNILLEMIDVSDGASISEKEHLNSLTYT